jgi:GT2 family glycosyltransferase
MKISVVIPHMYGLPGIDHLLKKCVKSLVGHDEVIVMANDGIGYGAACNLGMRLATGDLIVLSNNDCYLEQGTLRDLVVWNRITVPRIYPPARDDLPRPFFGVPRHIYEEIYEKYGDFFDERFEGGYFEDDDLHRRMEESEIHSQVVEDVVVHHLNGGGTTMKQIGEQEHYVANLERFNQKWSA